MSKQIILNRTFGKHQLRGLIEWVWRRYGPESAIEAVDRLKKIGFRMATKSGISLGVVDLLPPKEKKWAMRCAERKVTFDLYPKMFKIQEQSFVPRYTKTD